MLGRVGRALLWGAIGYVAGAVATYWLIMWLSSNAHDRSLEASMTAAFVGGPLCAVVGLVAGAVRRSAASA